VEVEQSDLLSQFVLPEKKKQERGQASSGSSDRHNQPWCAGPWAMMQSEIEQSGQKVYSEG
jgi:hypothetical protein